MTICFHLFCCKYVTDNSSRFMFVLYVRSVCDELNQSLHTLAKVACSSLGVLSIYDILFQFLV